MYCHVMSCHGMSSVRETLPPLYREERDTLSFAYRRSASSSLWRRETHNLLCREKAYVIQSMEKRDILSSASRRSMSSFRWRRETHSPLHRERVCHALYIERRHTLLCKENESPSSPYRRETLSLLQRVE